MARTARPRSSLIRALGISGWDGADAVVLAALATEAPLLLLGPHGSAKSLLLTRLAGALGLAHRHYNASLLSYDDLVGFPSPKATTWSTCRRLRRSGTPRPSSSTRSRAAARSLILCLL